MVKLWPIPRILLTPLIISFASIAETAGKNVGCSHKHFSDYCTNESNSGIILQPTNEEKIASIISSLYSDKASGSNI